MALTLIFCVLFTVLSVLGVKPMLRFMNTPEDVFDNAVVYLTIYFLGISGLLIYNMGSGILRAVGDSTRPLIFLIMTSILNTVLDLVFVLVLKMGIAGVAFATILSQAISAALILITRSDDIYRLSWKDLSLDTPTMRRIFSVALPTGIQSVITSFSNIFVQSYVNHFGSAVMAGWSSYNKLDTFITLPMQSMTMAATTFVSQNIGAKNEERANRGTVTTILMSFLVTAVITVFLFFYARPAVRLFSKDADVIEAGALFIRANNFFLLLNCVNHVLASALRGRGDSRAPMFIMLACFVGARQIYLYLVTHFVANTPLLVGLGYPVGWTLCFIVEVAYFLLKYIRGSKRNAAAA